MSKIVKILSGGQSGADRGAMDAAQRCGMDVGGWCPAGGWAEDYPDPPGVLALYPQMTETPSSDVAQRTEWNIRDSNCCIVLNTHKRNTSPGTDIGYAFYEKYHTPHFEILIDNPEEIEACIADACAWLQSLDEDALVISIGGPRASEFPDIYDIAFHVVESILSELA